MTTNAGSAGDSPSSGSPASTILSLFVYLRTTSPNSPDKA